MATMACLALLATSAAAEPICKESLGEYYVNIGIANTGFGTGLDDAFEVVIRRIRPSSEQDLERLKAFNYFEGKDEKGEAYSDGRRYEWLKEGREYRLFRKVSGRKSVRIDVFVVTFSPANRMKNMMRLMNANRDVYTQLGLESRLKVLGIMGVAFRGSHGTVDFINNLKADPDYPQPTDLGKSPSARVYVSNADTMLARYARTAGYDWADPASEDVNWDVDWTGKQALNTLLLKKDEQYVLDNLSTFIEKQNYGGVKENDITLDKLMSTFGDIVVAGLKSSDIKYIFKKCIPSGVSTYGSPRAAFVPLKVTDGNTSYYPVFVFPSAFSSTDALNFEIWKTGTEVRWWNAAAYLDVADDKQKGLREAVLRYDVPHLMRDYFKSPLSKPDTAEFSVHKSHQSLLKSSLDVAEKKPEAPRAIPWTVPGLVMAETAGSMVSKKAEHAYNEFFANRVPDIRWYMTKKLTEQLKEAVSSSNKKDEDKDNSSSIKEKPVKKLVDAIAEGYAITAEERTKALAATLDASALYFDYLKSLKDVPEAERSGALELINKIKLKGYSFSDLLWLNEVTQNYPLPEKSLRDKTVGKRMKYLVETMKVQNLKNIDKALSDTHIILLHRDKQSISDMLDATLKRGTKAVADLKAKTDEEKAKIKDYDKKIAAIEDINQQLKILSGSLAGTFQAKTDAETAAKNAVSPKESSYSASYDEMSVACKGENFSPSRTGTDDALYRDIYNAYLFNDEKLIACTPKANAFAKARQEYRDTLEEQDQKVSEKAKAVHELDDKADGLFDNLTSLVQLEDKAEIPANGFMKRGINKVLTKAGIRKPVEGAKSWKELIQRAFEQYLTATGSEEDAYTALEAHLKKVPELEIVRSNP